MDDNALQERIETHREHVGEAIEALAYKTDIVARGSEALAEGIEVAKEAALHLTEEATVRTVDLTVRASDALAEAITTAEASAADVLDFAATTVEAVEPRARRRATYAIGFVTVAAIFALLLRRRSSGDD